MILFSDDERRLRKALWLSQMTQSERDGGRFKQGILELSA